MAAALAVGSALTSYHQPMLPPEKTILSIAATKPQSQWQAIHVLSGACGCSQRVMHNLLLRGHMKGTQEQIVLADGSDPYLPGTNLLLQQLKDAGFEVIHRKSTEIAREIGIKGLPLLAIISPSHKVEYLGGYGMKGDQADLILTKTMAGNSGSPLPIFGCAIGERVRKEADPLGLKYGGLRNRFLQAFGKVPSA